MATSSSSSSTSADVKTIRAAQLTDSFKADSLTLHFKNMKALLDSGKYADVILKAGGKEFKAHKVILATSSPVFANMFYKENTADARKDSVDITDVSADVFQEVLRYIYTGEVQKMEMYASELLSAACKYQLDVLQSYCDQYSLLTYRSTFPVTHLPDLALLCVFKQLPPADQITARQVCTRWATLVPESARAVRSLSIVVGAQSLAFVEEKINCRTSPDYFLLKHLINEDGTPMYPTRRLTEWNSLQYRNLDEDTVRQITSTFKIIKQLQFATDTSNQHLITILGHWRRQLTTLKLYHLDRRISADITTRLFAAINSMSVLKSLVLGLGLSHYRDLSVLCQLVDITICLPGSLTRPFFDSLQRHAEHNTSLLRIDANVDPSDIHQFTSLNDHLCARFISLSDWHFPSTALEVISTRFPSLTTLSIESPSSLRHLFTSLSRLTELIYLSLGINFTEIEADQLEHLLLPQLKSIKALTLLVTVSSHLELSQLHIPRTMPNLQVIYIDWYCTTCRIHTWCNDTTMKANPDKAKECLRQILRPLKRECPKLRHIQHDHEDIIGTAEELLAE